MYIFYNELDNTLDKTDRNDWLASTTEGDYNARIGKTSVEDVIRYCGESAVIMMDSYRKILQILIILGL